MFSRSLRSSVYCAWWGVVCAAVVSVWSPRASGQTQYTATMASIDQHSPAPEWFQDGKLGIWFHWGAHTTPQFYSEWYPHFLYDKSNGGGVYQHHLSTYGDPFADWPYEKFITGGTDKSGKFVQFAPKLLSAGGNWDPDAWAQLFVDAGARFAGQQMEHHDGFAMWDSKVNEWNAASKGPMLNIAKLNIDAFRKRGLKIMAAFHHAYNFQGYWQFAPTHTDPSLQKLYGQLSPAAENQLWLDQLKEVVDEFEPDIIYQDSFTPQTVLTQSSLLQFAAYYYNAALAWNKEVVATYKDGYDNKGEVYDYERGGPPDIANPYWTTDDTVGPNTWGYVAGMTYYSSAAIIHAFIDRVSKNGNLLLNICPMADGTIPKEQQDILRAIGAFLKQFGTAIYETRAWTVYGEGPTKMGGCSICAPTAGTPQDVRYTSSKHGDVVYAIMLGWPGNGKQVNLTSVTTSRFAVGSGQVFLFGPTGGSPISLTFTQDGSGLHVTLPSTQPYTAVAYAMAISPSGTPPAPTPWLTGGSGNGGTGGASASGGAAGAGGPGTGGTGEAGGAGNGGAAGTTTSTGGGAGISTSGAAGTGRAAGTGGVAGASTLVGAGGTSGAGAGSGQTQAQTSASSSGCSCEISVNRHRGGGFLLLGLALASAAARRKRAPRA